MMMDVHLHLYFYRDTFILNIYFNMCIRRHIPFISFYLDTVGCSRSCVHDIFNYARHVNLRRNQDMGGFEKNPILNAFGKSGCRNP